MIVSDSSNIASIDWQEDEEEGLGIGHLVVTFRNGRVYRYDNVSESIYRSLETAATAPGVSLGRTFNEMVRSNADAFPATEITDAVV